MSRNPTQAEEFLPFLYGCCVLNQVLHLNTNLYNMPFNPRLPHFSMHASEATFDATHDFTAPAGIFTTSVFMRARQPSKHNWYTLRGGERRAFLVFVVVVVLLVSISAGLRASPARVHKFRGLGLAWVFALVLVLLFFGIVFGCGDIVVGVAAAVAAAATAVAGALGVGVGVGGVVVVVVVVVVVGKVAIVVK